MKYLFLAILPALSANAAVTVSLPGESARAGWDQLTNANFGPAAGFPTYGTKHLPWPTQIAPNVAGTTATASFSKLSGSGYFASSSIYDGGSPGLYSIAGSSVVPFETIVLQLDVGTPIGVLPTLNFNGGSQALAADFEFVSDGDYETFNLVTGESGPTINRAFQWDLSGFDEEIVSYEISWGSVSDDHFTQYAFDLTVGDTFAQAIPEPTSAVLAALGLAAICGRRRRVRNPFA